MQYGVANVALVENCRKTITRVGDRLMIFQSSELVEVWGEKEIRVKVAGLSEAWCYSPPVVYNNAIYMLSSPGIFRFEIGGTEIQHLESLNTISN